MKKTAPVFLAFLAMGFADVAGPLVSLAQQTFALSTFMAELLPFSGFLFFGLLSVPMGVLQDRKGKKYLLVLGLSVALAGLLIPIVSGLYGPKPVIAPGAVGQFYVVMASILLLGAGAAILQVVGNPVMRDVSPPGAYSRNLSLAQGVKAVGSSLGFLLPPLALAYLGLDWPLLFPVYAALSALALLACLPLELHEAKDPASAPATLGSCLALLAQNRFVLLMSAGIFVYVGAEVCLSSGVPLLLKNVFGIGSFGLWISWTLFFLPIMLGRFAGALILRRMRPALFLALTSALSIAGLLLLIAGPRDAAFLGSVLAGLGFANVFPLIFSITVDAYPAQSNEISGLMITAIVGGAIIPPLMGLLADAAGSVRWGFLTPLAAFAYIAWLAAANLRAEAAPEAPAEPALP
ncbi:MAG TPA: MFS transporter [Elusimicrobiota bacterium]|nr:MFS transporter [Elusimicrobiota bacterium]